MFQIKYKLVGDASEQVVHNGVFGYTLLVFMLLSDRVDSLQKWMKGQDTEPNIGAILFWCIKVKRGKSDRIPHIYQWTFRLHPNHKKTFGGII